MPENCCSKHFLHSQECNRKERLEVQETDRYHVTRLTESRQIPSNGSESCACMWMKLREQRTDIVAQFRPTTLFECSNFESKRMSYNVLKFEACKEEN